MNLEGGECGMTSVSCGNGKLRQWLIDQIDSGKYPGLVWENDEKSIFRIPWKHAGKQDYNREEDAALFKVGLGQAVPGASGAARGLGRGPPSPSPSLPPPRGAHVSWPLLELPLGSQVGSRLSLAALQAGLTSQPSHCPLPPPPCPVLCPGLPDPIAPVGTVLPLISSGAGPSLGGGGDSKHAWLVAAPAGVLATAPDLGGFFFLH